MKSQHRVTSTRRRRPGAARRQGTWIRYGLFGLGGLVLAALLFLSFGRSGAQTVVPPRAGAPLSDFTLSDIHGQKVQLSDYAGQVVLVNSWATWCPPCRAEMPDLNAYYRTHRSEGFVVLAINAGEPAASAAAFAQANGLAFPVLLDPGTKLLDGFGIQSFPTSIVVGRDGRVKTIHVGIYSPQALEADITPLLSQ